jgi:hypothetical protein
VAATEDNVTIYGSQVLTINAETFIAESIEVNRPMQKVRRRNQIGEPAGSVYIPDFVEGEATVQVENDPPLQGEEFTATLDAGIGSETFIVTSVSNVLTQDDIQKCNISFDLKLS